MRHEVIDFLADVKDDDDTYYEEQCDEEGEDEFLHYIKIQYSRFKIHSFLYCLKLLSGGITAVS